MRRQGDTRVYQKQPGGPYYADIRIKGVPRVRFSTETTDPELAHQVAAERKRQMILVRDGIAPPDGFVRSITLSQAFGRYQAELAGRPDAENADRYAETALGYFTRTRAFDTLSTALITDYRDFLRKRRRRKAGGERVPVSNRTVNTYIAFLRRVCRVAARWKVRMPPMIEWADLFLEEADPPTRIIRGAAEEKKVHLALAEDSRDLIDFITLSGLRRFNAVFLRWAEIDRQRGIVTVHVKSKKPGGKKHEVHITPTIAAILDRQAGLHPVYVFTYVCQKSRSFIDKATGERGFRRKGERYPFTVSVITKRWNAMRAATGFHDLGIHRLRATAITRIYDESGNLKVAQKFAGHSDAATTLRYISIDADDVRRAMLGVEADRAPQRPASKRRKAGQVIPLRGTRRA